MKLIDEKGKIFGKVNIIDLLIVLIILALVAGVGYKMFFQNNNGVSEQPTEMSEADITFLIKGCLPEAQDALKEGDKLIINNAITDAEITEIDVQENKTTAVTDQGEMIVTQNPLAIDITITVKANVQVSNAGVTLADETMKVNSDFEIETKEFFGNAKIIKVSCEE